MRRSLEAFPDPPSRSGGTAFALARLVPTIARDGHLWAVRLDRGAVLLHSRRGRIVEVEEDVASTLDLVLFDRDARLPATESEALRMRRGLRALREELLDDELVGRPRVEMEKGETLLRRYIEPAQWRRPTALRQQPMEGALLTLGLVRRDDGGVVALAGPRTVVTTVTSAFSGGGIDPNEVVLRGGDAIVLRTTTKEELRPVELWTVEVGDRPGLTLVRLSPARALVKLLLASSVRPSEMALSVLGEWAERVPHFGALLPRSLPSLTRAVTEYFRAAIP